LNGDRQFIDNAIKYADEGGSIRLWTYQSSDKVWVSVGNTGNIIPEEDLRMCSNAFIRWTNLTPDEMDRLGLFIFSAHLGPASSDVHVHSKAPQGTILRSASSRALKSNKLIFTIIHKSVIKGDLLTLT
jgi:K+-sensing histidine kinase KdpD